MGPFIIVVPSVWFDSVDDHRPRNIAMIEVQALLKHRAHSLQGQYLDKLCLDKNFQSRTIIKLL